ncbi:hypothetical protein FQN54_009037 [Arachnomyces sp. PD_36]|nr:hypothetical protein FQN54_009037 [Arachnomyces sp. PD_36]
MGESGVLPQPSLYLAFRLARLVHKFRHHLQERVLVRKRSKNPFGDSQRRGLRLRASSDVEKTVFPPRLCLKTEAVSPTEHEFNGQWANSLLHELDGHANRKTLPLAQVAADEKLFLSQSTTTLVDTVSPATNPQHAAYLFDLSSLLIDRLDVFRSQQPTGSYHSSCGQSGLQLLLDATFIANLLHLLLRLQRRLFQVLVNQSIQQIEEITRHWREYWQQQRKLGGNWFNEWPDGRRPLSTTWPWNIRPSLVILWGVCWMFYNNVSPHVEQSNGFWSRQDQELSAPQQQEDVPPNNELIYDQAGTGFQLWDQGADAAVAHPNDVDIDGGINYGLPDGVFSGSAPISPEEFVALSNPVTSEPQLADAAQAFYLGDRGAGEVGTNETGYPCIPQDYTRDQHLRPPGPNHRHQIATPATIGVSSTAPVLSGPPLAEIQGFRSFAEPLDAGPLRYNPAQRLHNPAEDFQLFNLTTTPYVPSYQSPISQLSSPLFQRHSPLVGPDMATSVEYISPSGDGPSGLQSRTYSIEKSSPSTPITIEPMYSTMPGMKPRLSVRRDQDPPKNEAGEMYCDHPDCREKPPTFRRPCEWNKHMDKHDRPYKCQEPGCDKIRGFTYSGGLLRHQREVHKKNIKSKSPRMCPYPDCNRSTGVGFTRQENLKEHLRRRHMHTDISPDMPLAKTPDVEAMPAPSIPALPPSPALGPVTKKRKRSTDHQTPSTATSDDGSEDSTDPRDVEIKRLRRELENNVRRVQQLEHTLASLQQTLHRAHP